MPFTFGSFRKFRHLLQNYKKNSAYGSMSIVFVSVTFLQSWQTHGYFQTYLGIVDSDAHRVSFAVNGKQAERARVLIFDHLTQSLVIIFCDHVSHFLLEPSPKTKWHFWHKNCAWKTKWFLDFHQFLCKLLEVSKSSQSLPTNFLTLREETSQKICHAAFVSWTFFRSEKMKHQIVSQRIFDDLLMQTLYSSDFN